MSIYAGVGGVVREVAGDGLKPTLVASGSIGRYDSSSRFSYSFKLNTLYILVLDSIVFPAFVFTSNDDEFKLINPLQVQSGLNVNYQRQTATVSPTGVTCGFDVSYKLYEF